MNLKGFAKRLIPIILIISILSSFAACGSSNVPPRDERNYTLYECNGRVISLSTKIEVKKEGEDYCTIKGNIFTLVTDPLTMYDLNEERLAYAGDTYHFINQDSHGIYVGREFTYDMVGKFEWYGEEYEIYDYDEYLVGKLKFSPANFEGHLTNIDGKIIAEYESFYGFYDFNIKIYDDCEIDELSVLMIFASYYSDYHYDEG